MHGCWEGEKNNKIRGLRNNEIKLLRTSEIADAGVSNIGRLLSRHDVVPYAHLFFSLSLSLSHSLDGGGALALSLSVLFGLLWAGFYSKRQKLEWPSTSLKMPRSSFSLLL